MVVFDHFILLLFVGDLVLLAFHEKLGHLLLQRDETLALIIDFLMCCVDLPLFIKDVLLDVICLLSVRSLQLQDLVVHLFLFLAVL